MKNLLLIVVLFFAVPIGFAQENNLRTKHFNLKNDVAIQGYDPVSYFEQEKPVKGKAKFSLTHAGVRYNFSSKENKEKFEANPQMYEPQYGGWCAFAMGDYGSKVAINPETFKIVDGKLYLFYNAFFNNTLKSWNKDEKNLKSNADKNWKSIYK